MAIAAGAVVYFGFAQPVGGASIERQLVSSMQGCSVVMAGKARVLGVGGDFAGARSDGFRLGFVAERAIGIRRPLPRALGDFLDGRHPFHRGHLRVMLLTSSRKSEQG